MLDFPGSHTRRQVLFPEKPSHEIHQRGLIVFGNPAGKKVYFDSSRRQGSGCFVEMKLAESRGNDCFQTLLFDVHARLVVVVISAAIILGVIRRLQVHRIQHHAQKMGSGTEEDFARPRYHIP